MRWPRKNYGSQERWLAVRNDDALEAPPFAVLEVAGYDAGVLVVRRPTAASAGGTDLVLINSMQPIPSGGYGSATRHFPMMARGTGVVASGSWELFAGFTPNTNEGFFTGNALGSFPSLPSPPSNYVALEYVSHNHFE